MHIHPLYDKKYKTSDNINKYSIAISNQTKQ